ncbi:TetR/AcrR family transcriptional regulator [Streptomyces sp. NPDC005438]|uniref:TetR/AcrR family transcriptional regulator n=1 Tax=Streptomyces sp. NPDC005438 TaxID=3156880 RepID=UPI0033B76A78
MGGQPEQGGTGARRPRYRRLSVEERRAQLLRTALSFFAHRDPEDVSLDEVAAEAEVSRPLVYRYFPGGKQQLYEAALRSAAEALAGHFDEPEQGPLSLRLSRALDRYLEFVDRHDTGFAALMRGGSVAETSRTTAIVDQTRRAASREVLRHLGATQPGSQLRMMVRTWISAVEAASLIWLDEGKRQPAEELRDWLVDHFLVLLLATASRDEQTREVVDKALELEERDGPVGRLLRGLAPSLERVGHLL